MNPLIKQQLNRLAVVYRATADGVFTQTIPDTAKKVIFLSANTQSESKPKYRVTFESYFVMGFPGFDFHEKFNKGVAPPSVVMYGEIVRETEKMYYFKLKGETGTVHWEGYCPKKSCKVQLL